MAACLLALSGCSTTERISAVGPAEVVAPGVRAVEVGLADSPIVMIPRPGDPEHVWVAERAGRVLRFALADGQLQTPGEPVIDITAETMAEGERGLLGMAFAADGMTLYLSYTNTDGNTRIDAVPLSGSSTAGTERRNVYGIDQPFANHNGGHIVLGPDGALWLGLGDGGAGNDPDNRAQNPNTDLGKIVRIDVSTGRSQVMVSGVRNPWRFAFNPEGDLWVADVGQGSVEEVDFLPADKVEGANLGWSGFEGSHPHLDDEARRGVRPIMPVVEYLHESGNCSITGGFEYRGSEIGGLEGAFLYVDYCAGKIRAAWANKDGTLRADMDLGVEVELPQSFGQDAAGEAYVLSGSGSVLRLRAEGAS